MDKMIGNKRDSGCNGGKHCTCNSYYRTKKFTRIAKRRERASWKAEVFNGSYA